ncbi:galectin-4 isoform X2 [Scaptodrosophila lebanonensis]|nr:galectin-4 isoform X2 [Scaptodrosophila lebanonensis]
MNVSGAIRSIALRRNLDAMSIFYEERSAVSKRFHLKLLGVAMPGLSFFFRGLILDTCEHFCIEFLTNRSHSDGYDVALQMGARLPQNYVVRNSRFKGKWGPEECASNLPFQLKRGHTFWMQVLLTAEAYFISVNGFHFAEYEHRMPYRWLSSVEVRGDVTDIVIDQYYVTEYPNRLPASMASPLPFVYESCITNSMNETERSTIPREWLRIDVPSKYLKLKRQLHNQLTLPFYGRMPQKDKLTEGRALRIEGRVRLLPQSFSVALQRGQDIWPQPTVSFYFCPSFARHSRAKLGKAIITRSAYINGAWVKREVSRLHTNFGPGKAFVILIACRRNGYELFVNNKSLLRFKHQMNPAGVDIVNIRGDIKLWDVVVESTRLIQGRTARSIFERAFGTLRPGRSE